MRITRRTLMQGGAAAVMGGLVPRWALAQTSLTIGAATIDTVSDGGLVLPTGMILSDVPADEAHRILADYGLDGDTLTPECNLTLLRQGDRVVLFDAGSGTEFMPSAGKLPDAMAALGVGYEDITDVVFTHAHPDHLWGLLDDFADIAFPNAAFHIGRAEWDYWTDPDTVSTINEERVVFAVGAQNRLGLLVDQINLIEDGQEVLPGVGARLTAGHTPGHMSYIIGEGSDAVMVLGDCIANHHLAFAKPAWHSGSDQDQDMGAQTRAGLIADLASSQMPVIGFHLPGGGIGHVETAGEGFVFRPAMG